LRAATVAIPAAVIALATPAVHAAPIVEASVVWSYDHNGPGAGTTSEIVAHDPDDQRVYVAGGDGVDVLDAVTGALITTIPLDTGRFDGVNSVAVKNGKVAIAAAASNVQQNGAVLMYDTSNLAAAPTEITVGANPDMVTFAQNGTKLLVANEGEPNDDYDVDPVGSVSVVDVATSSVQTAGFSGFDAQKAALIASGVRIFGPGATVSQDLEPEYIAISPDGTKAYVTLQENNALAIVDISGAVPTVTDVVPLGYKDHGVPGQGIDPSDRDPIEIKTLSNVLGMYQPDAIASFEKGGTTYLITANEGDARDYDGFAEEARVKDLSLSGFPAGTGDDDEFGRLNVTTTLGQNGSGDYEELYAFGARSFSILDEDGTIIFDSGDMIEQILIDQFPDFWPDGREDNKGPEPESVVVGEVGDLLFAFVGLERSDAIMVFGLDDPLNPYFAGLIYNDGDEAPEGLAFIGEDDSADGFAYLAIGNEDSGTTTMYRLTSIPEPSMALIVALAAGGMIVRTRQRR
tara:strand:- start:284 stop:1834 length:1551 start_codon:yes stop_codon:yes gene_type:complete